MIESRSVAATTYREGEMLLWHCFLLGVINIFCYIEVEITQHYECAKHHQIVYFKTITFM